MAGVCLVILSLGATPSFIGRELRKSPLEQGNLRRPLSLSQIWQRPPKSVAGCWDSAGKLQRPLGGGRGGIPSSCLLGWGKGLADPRLQTGSALRFYLVGRAVSESQGELESR